MESNSTAFLIKIKLRHSLGRPSRSDFVQSQFEEVNTLDIEKTESYYNQIRNEDLCDCDYCRNNIHEVKAAYPTSFIDTP